MRELSNVRPALKRLGDDVTLTRWVKLPGRHAEGNKAQALAPTDATGTRFPSRVLRTGQMKNLLVSGHNNIKLGRDVRKGRLNGYWIYSLSLEERATCPRSCLHWLNCYGNAMPFAKRIDHTDIEFLPRLESEVARLCKQHPAGVLIRLHALGDFYSTEYVDFWRRMLRLHPMLAVFGYTARNNEDAIGEAVIRLRHTQWDRFAVRSSNGARHDKATLSIKDENSAHDGAFICPEQSGKTQCCATCGACWSTTKNVAFMEH